MFKGTDESSSSENEELNHPTIQKNMILNEGIDLNHIICSICMHIVWQPMVCGSHTGCYNAFCDECITVWLQSSNRSCPTCKRPFIKSPPPPILKSLLEALVIRCSNHNNGCSELIRYSFMGKHIQQCQYALMKCKGCRKKITKKEYHSHVNSCNQVIVECLKCSKQMTRGVIKDHSRSECLAVEIISCGKRVENIDQGIQQVQTSFQKLQQLTKCFLLGEPLQLNIQVYTTFNQHFVFPNPTLIKPSFNQQKEKFDFLHFYILNPIYTGSIASIKWGIKINKMVGNILLGFCNNMGVNSLDFVINKHGQLKKKSLDETKYKLIRQNQNGFMFCCGDVIKFRYYSLSKCIKIQNQTKRVNMVLEDSEISQLGDKIYIFYSMDTLNDSISFL